MNIEEYFDFISPDDIRVKGTRIGIESILYEYIFREKTAEEIAEIYPSLNLDQIYAVILYYLKNQHTVDQYMTRWLNQIHTGMENQQKNPPSIVIKLRQIKKKNHVNLSSE